MIIGRKERTLEPKPRRWQFRLRTLFVWTSVVAVLAASLGGAFGVVGQIVAAILVFYGVVLVVTLVLEVGLLIAVDWLCQQVTKLWTKSDRESENRR